MKKNYTWLGCLRRQPFVLSLYLSILLLQKKQKIANIAIVLFARKPQMIPMIFPLGRAYQQHVG